MKKKPKGNKRKEKGKRSEKSLRRRRRRRREKNKKKREERREKREEGGKSLRCHLMMTMMIIAIAQLVAFDLSQWWNTKKKQKHKRRDEQEEEEETNRIESNRIGSQVEAQEEGRRTSSCHEEIVIDCTSATSKSKTQQRKNIKQTKGRRRKRVKSIMKASKVITFILVLASAACVLGLKPSTRPKEAFFNIRNNSTETISVSLAYTHGHGAQDDNSSPSPGTVAVGLCSAFRFGRWRWLTYTAQVGDLLSLVSLSLFTVLMFVRHCFCSGVYICFFVCVLHTRCYCLEKCAS